MSIETKVVLRSRFAIASASDRAFGMSAIAMVLAILRRASCRADGLFSASAAWMAAAASSIVIIFDSSTVVGDAASVLFGAGLLVAAGLGSGVAFDLRAVVWGAEFITAPRRGDWRPMTIPAATPSSASDVANKIPFKLTQNPSRTG